MSPDRKRADATRNAAVLLTAARDLVEREGSDISLDQVARLAGVGNATLYRHFPTREDLLAAVYADEVAALCAYGAEVGRASPPLDALFAWLDAFVVHVATKRPLALAATEGPGGRRGPRFAAWHASINAVAADLVEGARGDLRTGLTATDVLTLARGAALAADVETARRLTAYLRDGLSSGRA
ncbi:TetR/AcrR family transcriptional regulator [Paractinoplanes lichenicola]|uniref:TetR/AcrR family transcriptional regulator n=1 Tax=Paractinoplanes lichenicola TaxID=2802976 RepID=A0ABS1VL50_9ACTN|nr:TetR/AcrR family transcriptional regulator [Actinoplanes lichenicola]MBL7255444.1 TetR/AcrR family transcriptional regulator [Actinoplanes lichenicola]